MKKVLFAIVIGLAGCVPACKPAPTPEMNNTIVKTEALPDGQCLYSVDVKSDTGYTFIDSCGKYSVGEQF